jgi:phosphoglucomutase
VHGAVAAKEALQSAGAAVSEKAVAATHYVEGKAVAVVGAVANVVGSADFKIHTITTRLMEGQAPGTSGLRKKVVVFQADHYLENFIQATFNALGDALHGKELVVAGDGRFWNKEASNVIIRMAAANGVSKIVTGVDFLMSTPCVSHVIRARKSFGGIILTASHNPGGPTEDFGVKYNISNGGPAPESVTDAIFNHTKEIKEYKIAVNVPEIDFSRPGVHQFGPIGVEVIDAASSYTDLMKSIFNFPALRAFVARPDFKMTYDAMNGVAGPFARRIFSELGLPESVCLNGVPKLDFGGCHPDPNLTYAHDLVKAMGLSEHKMEDSAVPDFGAAADGDADRNMILGKRFFVTPSDSVAIIAANASAIPYFNTGLKGVARSMPTSAALDRVAQKLGVQCYEVPTGWKFFGNLMDAGMLSICGEESFGTGSDHIREKDGIWAVLAWLSILQAHNVGTQKLKSVEEIVMEHWKAYGRNYYSRYDYENVGLDEAKALMAHLVAQFPKLTPGESKLGEFVVGKADEFEYEDPVDKSISRRQGVRFLFTDGSRIIFRLSGTGSVGATIRLYVEKYDGVNVTQATQDAVKSLIDIALDLSKMKEFTGRDVPTVIT